MKATFFSTLLGMILLVGCTQNSDNPPKVSEIKDSEKAAITNSTSPTENAAPSTLGATTEKADTTAKSESSGDNTNEVAIIKTTEGDLVVEFWPEVAPKTVASFKKLARDKSYEGTIFHRIVDGFMIQGGDLISKDPSKESQYGSSNPGFTLPAEFSDRKHVRGVLSMARLGHDINSASSQFFICLADTPFLDGQYTAFGKLIKGDDVLTKIGKTPVKMGSGGERSKPTVRVEIKSVELVPRDQVK